MKYLSLLLVVGLMVGCASGVKKLDTQLDSVQGQTQNGVIGLKDNQAVIQEKRSAEDELRVQVWKNYQLENDLNHEYYMVLWCYDDLADPRLGGNGEVSEAPNLKKIKNSVAVKEEFGLEDKRLVVVKTSSFEDELKVERQYETAMTTMLSEVKRTRGACERKMGVARIKAGLPSKRYQGKPVITPAGTLDHMIAPHESNLDNAFKIKEQDTSNATSKN